MSRAPGDTKSGAGGEADQSEAIASGSFDEGKNAMGSVGAFGMILAGAGLVGIVASYIWGMAGAKK